MSASVALPPADYPGFASAGAFWREALRRIEELPAVSAVGVSTGLPPDFAGNTNNFDLANRPRRG